MNTIGTVGGVVGGAVVVAVVGVEVVVVIGGFVGSRLFVVGFVGTMID